MEVYYGSNKRGTTLIYAPYYFAGMSLKARTDSGFRFRFDFLFLDRLAKRSLNLEHLALRGWNIQRVNINHCYLDVLLDSIYFKTKKKTKKRAYEIVEMTEGLVMNDYKRKLEHEEGYFDWDTPEEFLQDKWWDNGLAPPFFDENVDWNQEDYQE